MNDANSSSPHASRKQPVKRSTSAPDLYTGEPPLQSAHNTWAKVKTDLGYALGPNVHRSWTGQLRVSQANERIVTLAAPSRFIASKIEANYADTVRRLWKKHDMVAPPRDIIFSATNERSALASPTPRRKAAENTAPLHTPYLQEVKSDVPVPADLEETKPTSTDNPRDRFTFDNFVVGASNELAFAVARQIASCRAPQYNPIVIHGANGMGKTHLLHAIEDAARASDPSYRVKLISSENFVSAFVSSVRGTGRDAIEAFKASLRDVDLLIIDDAHFIADKPGSQEELLHTLVSLVAQGRQILIAADRHPDKIEKASDRLKSYLSSGLVCRIGAADYELRLRILDRLIQRRRASGNPELAIPQNARDHLAARMNATPRDLEGAFNQIVAQSEFLGTPITLETVQDTLSDSRYMAGQRLTVDRIQRAVCEAFGLSLTDMVSKRRARQIARPRQVAMYLSKKLTKRSLPDIGRRFGGRDHTTVMHAVKRIDELRAVDAEFNGQIEAVEATLKT
ncbi:chromosomal replication initiator protein DnaA [Litorimonas taeanensis]|uniref:Chromosomal replication initiator protein DnaA n=1 Tax=Litorimonas taeanensis TaxID=568099 RepID=A0A420WEQ1_9PROT|nr:chromosomal replication initiator protein DnaA [Litorimonas taeanensis]RKQ69460.1 chromosomal replication initiator protein DnaA [Litorimonas taeanensis]